MKKRIKKVRVKQVQYFLKDSELTNIKDDRFNQADVIDNLKMIIENTESPYNIAIIGKWGIGKSSLLKMLFNEYEKNNAKYIVHQINAWKYEQESLKRVFLKQLWQKIEKKKIKTFDQIKRIYGELIDKGVPKKEKFFTPHLISFLIYFIIIMISSLILFFFYKGVQINWNWNEMARDTFLGYCKRVMPIVIAPTILAYVVKIATEKETKKLEINLPVETTDDMKFFLKRLLTQKLKIKKL